MSLAWLFPKARWTILKALFAHPEEDFYVSQLIRLAGGGSAHVQRELRHFTQSGLLIRKRAGNQVRYQANPAHPVFRDLHSLVLKTEGLVEVLRKALTPVEGIQVAFVYGSLARADDRAPSDVDLMVIGEVGFGEISDRLIPAERTLRREVNPSVFPPEEFRERLAAGSGFVTRVIAGPKLFIIGDAHDLERVGGASQHRRGGLPDGPAPEGDSD